jgi:hypothetical protein
LSRRRPSEFDEVPPYGLAQWGQLVLKMTSATAVIVIAGFLVWRLSENLDSQTQKLETLTLQHAQMSQQNADNFAMTRRMLVVLRVMCVNAAKTEQARQACIEEHIP